MYKKHNEILKTGIENVTFSFSSRYNFESKEKNLEYSNALDDLTELELITVLKNNSIRLTPLGRKIYNEKSLKEFIDKKALKELKKEEKENIDFQLAKKMLKEYPKTKWFARIGFIIGVVLMLKELYIWIIQLQFQ